VSHNYLVKKPGKKIGRGAADMYRWNDSKGNPLWNGFGDGHGNATGTPLPEFKLEPAEPDKEAA
jgi:hypothetical protein